GEPLAGPGAARRGADGPRLRGGPEGSLPRGRRVRAWQAAGRGEEPQRRPLDGVARAERVARPHTARAEYASRAPGDRSRGPARWLLGALLLGSVSHAAQRDRAGRRG